MPLTEPVFDSRSYREILNEALALAPWGGQSSILPDAPEVQRDQH